MMKVVLPQIFALLYTYFFVSYECSSIVAAAVSNFFVNSFPSVNNFRREERGEKELETRGKQPAGWIEENWGNQQLFLL